MGTPELRARKMRLLCGFLQTEINPLGGWSTGVGDWGTCAQAGY